MTSRSEHRVGPVLSAGPVAAAVLAAIREENADVHVLDRGAYWRVLVPERCVVTRLTIERFTNARFAIPRDLEAVMPAFQGRLQLSEERVVWERANAETGSSRSTR